MAKTIVEEPTVQQQVAKLEKQHRHFARAYRALKWRLARANVEQGEMGREIGKGLRLHKQAEDRQAGTPAILVMFINSPTENRINVIDVHVAEDSGGEF